MSMAGLTKSRLERMHRVLSGYVERKEQRVGSEIFSVRIAAGVSAYTDPAEGMIGILFTQRMM